LVLSLVGAQARAWPDFGGRIIVAQWPICAIQTLLLPDIGSAPRDSVRFVGFSLHLCCIGWHAFSSENDTGDDTMLLRAFDRPETTPRGADARPGTDADPAAAPGTARAYDPVRNAWVAAPEAQAPAASASSAHALSLRDWRPEDAAAYVGLLDDPVMWRFLPEAYPDPLTEADARALIDISNGMPHHRVAAIWCDGAPVGQVRVEFSTAQPREAEISYWIGRAHWGRGIAARAVDAFTAEVFATRPEVRQLFARVHPENAGSRAVMRKAGFVFQEKRQDAAGWRIYARRR
jgi:RimJ/RimL family protein N-acetyltransferase